MPCAALLIVIAARSAVMDFDAPGVTLERAVASLGDQLGELLTVSANIRNDVVVVHVSGVERADLFARIADAANAQWKTTQRGMALERSAESEAVLRRKSLDLRAKKLSEYLKPFEEALTREFTADDAKQISGQILALADRTPAWPSGGEMQKVWGQGPAGRLAHRLIRTINPDLVTDLPFGSRRVFSLYPTALQFPLGKGAEDAIASYANEQNIWSATVATVPIPANLMIASNPLTRREPVNGAPVGLVLEFNRTNSDMTVNCNLSRLSKDFGLDALYQVFAYPGGRFAGIGRPSTFPELSPLLRYLLREIGYFEVPMPEPPTEKDLAALNDPASYDIGGAFANAVFTDQYGKDDFVAVLSDQACGYSPYLLSVRSSREQFERIAPTLLEAEIKKDGGWTVIEPTDPYRTSRLQTPRAAVRALLASSRDNGLAEFADIAKFNLQLVEPSSFATSYLRALGISGWQQMASPGFWHISRLFGSLTPSQREQLLAGQPLAFGTLQPHQRQLFTTLATSKQIDSMEPVSPGLSRQAGRMGEPTVLFAGGIPQGAALTLEAKEVPSPIAYIKATDKFRADYATSAEQIAQVERSRSRADEPPANYPAGYAMGVLRRYKFRVMFAADMWQLFDVTELVADPSAEPGPWTSLPSDVVEQIKKGIGGT